MRIVKLIGIHRLVSRKIWFRLPFDVFSSMKRVLVHPPHTSISRVIYAHLVRPNVSIAILVLVDSSGRRIRSRTGSRARSRTGARARMVTARVAVGRAGTRA